MWPLCLPLVSGIARLGFARPESPLPDPLFKFLDPPSTLDRDPPPFVVTNYGEKTPLDLKKLKKITVINLIAVPPFFMNSFSLSLLLFTIINLELRLVAKSATPAPPPRRPSA